MCEEFSDAVLRQVVAQTCVALGCSKSKATVVTAMGDALKAYIRRVGEGIKRRQEHAGRSRPSVMDAAQALQSVDCAPTTWKGLQRFAFGDLKRKARRSAAKGKGSNGAGAGAEAGGNGEADEDEDDDEDDEDRWEQPFVFDVPRFPVQRRRRAHYGEEKETDERGMEGLEKRPTLPHKPAHLPPLPPGRALGYSDGDAAGAGNVRAVAAERRKRNRMVQKSLVKIVQSAGAAKRPKRAELFGAEEEGGGGPAGEKAADGDGAAPTRAKGQLPTPFKDKGSYDERPPREAMEVLPPDTDVPPKDKDDKILLGMVGERSNAERAPTPDPAAGTS